VESGEGPWHTLLSQARKFDFMTTQGTIEIRLPKGVVVILTDNPVGGEHMNVQPMDIALQDRLARFRLTYPPQAWETAWLCRETRIREKEAVTIMGAVNQIRSFAVDNGFESGGPSPRRSLMAARLVARGIPITAAIRHAVVNFYEGGDASSDRGRLTTYLDSKNLLRDAKVRG